MPYCDQADLDNRFGAEEIARLLDRDGDGQPDAGVLDAALADADAVIDAWLSRRYAVPLSPVPAPLVRLACVVTRFFLYDDKRPEEVSRDYDAAIKLLEKIANSEVSLGASGDGNPPSYTGGTRLFGAEELEGY